MAELGYELAIPGSVVRFTINCTMEPAKKYVRIVMSFVLFH